MSTRSLRILLDTNILIPAEDDGSLPSEIENLFTEANKHSAILFCHTSSLKDIRRDHDRARRQATLSRFSKYRKLEPTLLDAPALEEAFGELKSENDLVDAELLASIKEGSADFLVTRDVGLHKRAQRSNLSDQVLYPKQVTDLLIDRYGLPPSELEFVENVFCYQIRLDDPIFDSLKRDYDKFEDWYEKSCKKTDRRAWIVREKNKIAAIAIYKQEDGKELDAKFSGKKILKISTFKVGESYRGGRLGEHLLRQLIWYAKDNSYEIIYLTLFKKQESLNELLSYYGFEHIKSKSNGEIVLAKGHRHIEAEDLYDYCRLNYPNYIENAPSFQIIPIKSIYHERLFPERSQREYDLFTNYWTSVEKEKLIPATSMRKVYVCNAQKNDIPRGSLLYFYMSKDHNFNHQQCITSLGISESYETVSRLSEALKLTSQRTVYKENELNNIIQRGKNTRILNFLLVGYLKKPIHLDSLIDTEILNAAPQSVMSLNPTAHNTLVDQIEITTRI